MVLSPEPGCCRRGRDDALATYVAKMAELEQVTPLGSTVSYNNASLSLAGRLIEKVTGSPFEQAIKELLRTVSAEAEGWGECVAMSDPMYSSESSTPPPT
jgi:Beta-lactamase